MRFFFLLIFFIYSYGTWAQNFQVPPIDNFVNDYAHIISDNTEKHLNQTLAQIKKETAIEYAILTVDSLRGNSIEEASIQVVDSWKLGEKKSDLGILLFIAFKDRKLRIEVGQGLEGTLTDLKSKRIITNIMTPLLKQNRIDEAVLAGSYEILHTAAPGLNLDKYFTSSSLVRPSHNTNQVTLSPLQKTLIRILFILLLLFLIFTRPG
ncbi:MAG: TPM domain-containing protein, partial [Bdellovibrionales bacterium]|nr:TPM domain-containing protein [Bdellovibrionales bacterium]